MMILKRFQAAHGNEMTHSLGDGAMKYQERKTKGKKVRYPPHPLDNKFLHTYDHHEVDEKRTDLKKMYDFLESRSSLLSFTPLHVLSMCIVYNI